MKEVCCTGERREEMAGKLRDDGALSLNNQFSRTSQLFLSN